MQKPSPAHAVSAIVRRGDAYLLVLRANAPAARMYAFPGGRVEQGESLEEAVLRELTEETGIIGSNPQSFMQFDLGKEGSPGDKHFILTVFTVEETTLVDVVAADDAMDFGWYSIAEARTLLMPASMHDCFDMLDAEG